ncbi:Uncharacterised protein [Enterobacter cloacae]|nr:Uncharacterised protein [Enterobacter cloacae]
MHQYTIRFSAGNYVLKTFMHGRFQLKSGVAGLQGITVFRYEFHHHSGIIITIQLLNKSLRVRVVIYHTGDLGQGAIL